MRKWTLLLLLLGIFCLYGKEVKAAEIVASGQCGSAATWEVDEDGLLTISGTGSTDSYDWNSPKPPWSDDSVKKVIVSDGITELGAYSFAYCYDVTEIDLPDTLLTIGEDCFWDCKSLKSISIPSNVTTVGKSLFSFCSSLETVNGLPYISRSMFCYCSSLKSIPTAKDFTTIPEHAFRSCTSLKNVTIPQSITEIGQDAFTNSTAEIKILNNDIIMNKRAFGFQTTDDNVPSDTNCEIISSAVISANPNSSAYIYAKNNGINFSCISHTPKDIPSVAPTCTSTGLTKGSKCSVCEKILTSQHVIAKTAHTPITLPAVDPTTESTGLTEGLKCKDCGIILKKQQVIPKIVIAIDCPKGFDKDANQNTSYVYYKQPVTLVTKIKNAKIVEVKWSLVNKKKDKKYITIKKKTKKYLKAKLKKSSINKTIKIKAVVKYVYNEKARGTSVNGVSACSFYTMGAAKKKVHKTVFRYIVKVNGVKSKIKFGKMKPSSIKAGSSTQCSVDASNKGGKYRWKLYSGKSNGTMSSSGRLKAYKKKKGKTLVICVYEKGYEGNKRTKSVRIK